jgi:hypothetical protein
MRIATKSLTSIATLAFVVFGVVGDAVFNESNKLWNAFESFINLPTKLVVKLVGPGHGPAELVLPFLVSLCFYWLVFWALILGIQELRLRVGGSKHSNIYESHE